MQSARESTRQVTPLQAEHLPVLAGLARIDPIDPIGLRRNLVISGINLLALKNSKLIVGAALLEIVGPCQPCSRMEETIGPVKAKAAVQQVGASPDQA